MNSRNQTAQDGAMELIDVGSIVRINEGQLKDVNATVEHIYKGTIWVKARGVQRDGRIDCCLRSRQCFVHGGQGTRQGGAIPGLTPAMQSAFTNAPKSPGHALIAQSMGLTAQMANASGGMYQQPAVQQRRPVIQQRMGRERADPMVGKLVTIRRGVYAGYKGKVVDCGPKTARVELQAQARTVTVNRDELGWWTWLYDYVWYGCSSCVRRLRLRATTGGSIRGAKRRHTRRQLRRTVQATRQRRPETTLGTQR